MKQSIQLKLGQHLTMTPQLQQAIRLLQLSSLELQTEIQEVLDSNLMLEADEGNERNGEEQAGLNEPNGSDNATEAGTASSSEDPEPEATSREEMPDELPVDSSWDDVYDAALPSPGPSGDDGDFEVQRSISETLHDHLLWQLNLTRMSDQDRAIALAIIDSVGNDGYLNTSLEDIRLGLVEDDDMELELDEVEAVLRTVQNFDPPGVAARGPGECMLIQLRQLPEDTPWRQEACALVSQHLDLLANQQLAQLKRKLKVDDEALYAIINLIRSTNPRPGRLVEDNATQYIVPDVFVRKVNGVWRVELNAEASPRLRINANYASLVRRADNSDDNTYLRNHLQEARWFLKSLQSRNETLLKVASSIVKHQRGFLEYGEEAMRPLVLRDVAEDVEMHESTISRVTTQKFMHTPRGIFEFKFFFSSHVSTESGGECSATAIRALIKKLVAAEKPSKPLSDSRIAAILADQGIQVARRTVAKYREAMAIPPSNERKRLI
ncbi:MAG: RNA polymerase factor sigma-54 [Chromatiales bacterium]|nr:RNA polymerase factor sigma-54 [Chromatiales bacterium]